MRLSRVRRSTGIGMNMTPMIDIVFLLIIFFMTVSQITQSLVHPIDLPDVGDGGQTLETVSITVNIDDGGKMIVGGDTWQMPRLMAAIRKELQRVESQPSRIKILIRCDRNCPGKAVNELNKQLSQLGINRIRISVQGEE